MKTKSGRNIREKSWTIYCSILLLGNNLNYSERQKLHLEEVRWSGLGGGGGLENNLNWFGELNYWVIGYSQGGLAATPEWDCYNSPTLQTLSHKEKNCRNTQTPRGLCCVMKNPKHISLFRFSQMWSTTTFAFFFNWPRSSIPTLSNLPSNTELPFKVIPILATWHTHLPEVSTHPWTHR